jgi:protein associated with RNAse G/E
MQDINRNTTLFSEKNISSVDREEFLSMMRNVAYSQTTEEHELAEAELRSCHWFKHQVQKYIEHKWLSVKEVSMKAYKIVKFCLSKLVMVHLF